MLLRGPLRKAIRKTSAAEYLDDITTDRDKLLWIYRQLGRKEEELFQMPAKEYVSGEGFYYRRRKYRLKILDEPQPFRNGEPLRFQGNR